MQTRYRNLFTTICTEGAILPPDLPQRVSSGDSDLEGLKPEDYHLSGERINEATNRSWSWLQGAWNAFKDARDRLPENDLGTSVTRERWLLTLFEVLGYGRLLTTRAIEIEGKSYPISHQWGNTSIHLMGFRVDLDRRVTGVAGAARSSPHSLVQELLNRSDDHLWAFVSNGLRLRILRDNVSLTRQAYVEFDMEAMMDGEVYADFVLLWLLCHESRVEAERPEFCRLEKWSRLAQEQGTRALDNLRDGVEEAINALEGGFLTHPANAALRSKLQSGDLGKQDYYRQLLRFVYRLLFLFVAEDRELLLNPDAHESAKDRYTLYYSTSRIRRLAERLKGSRHSDLVHGLWLVMEKLGCEAGCPGLGLPALGSFLFDRKAMPDLTELEMANSHLLDAVRSLAFITYGSKRRPVDYKNLRSEELGSIYEALLELHPDLNVTAGTFELKTAGGHERKTTGSYYTPESLVQCLLDSALDPVLEEASKKPDPESAILSLKICDPATGSGHFLIAAAHRVARKLAFIRTGDEEPSPDEIQKALRDVISHCIYGVDINPMAVELCKVSLWMEALEPGKPLSFLDHRIQCGNSLLGITPALLEKGIPDDAFKPIEGDDRELCKEYRKRNKEERQQSELFAPDMQPWGGMGDMAARMIQLENIPDDTIEGIRQKQERYEEHVLSSSYKYSRLLADAWCAAFVWKKTEEFPYPITEGVFRQIEQKPCSTHQWMRDEINRLAEQYQFFHWHLAFPDVFRVTDTEEEPENEQTGWIGGFDLVLGNPPWEKIKLQEKEWFAERQPDIANAGNADERKRMITELEHEDPELYALFLEDRRKAEGESHLLRNSGIYPLCGRGDINTYSVFTELNRNNISSMGHVGSLVPSGVATDDTTKYFFQDLVNKQLLSSLYSFYEIRRFFPGSESREPFCMITLTGHGRPALAAQLSFFLSSVEELKDEQKQFTLTESDIALFNPNTRTCPIFRTKADAALTRKIYQRGSVLVNEEEDENPWGISFMRMIDMSNDSELFRTPGWLEEEGYKITGNRFVKESDVYLPLYEAKMIWQFGHWYATYEGATQANLNAGILPQIPEEQKQDMTITVKPRYWVSQAEVEARLKGKWDRGWILGFRGMMNATSEHTAIFSLMARVGAGNSIPFVMMNVERTSLIVCFLGDVNSLVFDYVARQKIAGTNINLFLMKQLVAFPPFTYNESELIFIGPLVLELVYTSWDIKPFADDVWRDGDEALRSAIQNQWKDNQASTGGHGWQPPEWAEIAEDGIPLPPFKWDEGRRAHIRAQLDAYYAKLYGLTEEELRYILDPKDVYGQDFPSETFRVLKEKEIRQFGEYRTKRLVLQAWDELKEK